MSYGGGIGGIISACRNGTPTYYHYDGIGAVTGLTDVNGKLLQSYSYDAFGNALMAQGQGKGAKNIVNPYGFSTKEYNAKSGLSYFGARYYDPAVGRFVTKDLWPGTIEDPGSFVNKYDYCNNNPVNLIDPLGLCPNTAQMVYDFLLGDDINTLCDPNAGAGYNLLAAASITSNFIPGGGVVKGFKLVRLASKGMKFTVKGAGKATGQLHHILSNKTMKALNEHPTLKGVFKREDAAFKYRAKDANAHKGYQQWQRDVDSTTVDWLQNNPNATPEQFKKFLNDLYQQPDISSKIPGVNIK